MSMLAGVIVLYIVALLIGKNIRQMKAAIYILMGVIACAQVALVFFMLYTMEFPRP